MNKKEHTEEEFEYTTGVDVADSLGLALICLCLVIVICLI